MLSENAARNLAHAGDKGRSTRPLAGTRAGSCETRRFNTAHMVQGLTNGNFFLFYLLRRLICLRDQE